MTRRRRGGSRSASSAFASPIVVDAEGVIIVGHTRYKAAQKLGLEKVPVHVATELTPEQIKAYRIADNKTNELSDWDYDLLPIELGELQALDYDLGLLGFDQDELARLLDPGVKEGLCDPDEVPEPPDEATTRPGDSVDSRRTSPALRRRRQDRRCGPPAWTERRSTWSTPIRPTTSRSSRAQARHRRRP
ncbi:MAG: hypothetical protein KatS3mg105_0604 [Gemmatales bacterium]|nr:MAG: hypothetical protein KatS3mg105_0604 [Gemmatales bacterium]